MCKKTSLWDRSVEYHGHICPGLVVGYRAALIALRELGVQRAGDEELVAIVENDACGVDAIQVITGCTLGKGNLIYRDYGKQVYTIGNRKNGDAVRIVVKGSVWRRDPEQAELMNKVIQGEATDEERELFQCNHQNKAQWMLNVPEDDFCTFAKIPLELPGKARIFNSVECAQCGESVMEARARVKNGQFVCIPCAGEYTRGW